MLKIWKQAWRKEESGQDLDVGRDNSQDVQMSGTDGDRSYEASTATVPHVFEHHILGPVSTSPRNLTIRRTRTIEELGLSDHVTADRPVKRQKLEESTAELSAVDLLSNHLPEVIDVDGLAGLSTRRSHPRGNNQAFLESVIAQAKQGNSEPSAPAVQNYTKLNFRMCSHCCTGQTSMFVSPSVQRAVLPSKMFQ